MVEWVKNATFNAPNVEIASTWTKIGHFFCYIAVILMAFGKDFPRFQGA